MTAETITREAVAKAIIDGLEGVEGSGQSDPGIWHLDDDLTDVGIDGHCDMLAAADAVLTLVDLSTRLAAARAEGLREGVEKAAKWHDDMAAELERRVRERDGNFVSGMHRVALAHREDASKLRACISSPAWTPTHRHYKGGLYRELMRVDGADGDELVPVVIYEDAAGRRFARAAEAFDGLADISPKHVARRFTPIPLVTPEPTHD